MKASELRIGNFVQDEHGVVKYVYRLWDGGAELTEDENGYEDLDYTEDEILGITITEEWLLEFDFEKKTNFKSHHFDKYPIEVRFDGVKPLVTLEFDSTVTGNYSYDCPTDFVHQLQNLYFELNREELKKINS